jgi:ubiquinone/menaquinone biosynthesis C-methylase UbiE
MKDRLRILGESKLLIDPLLGGLTEDSFPLKILEKFDDETKKVLDSCYNRDLRDHSKDVRNDLFGPLPVFDDLVYSCVYGFFLGTCSYVSHDMKGCIDIDDEIAEMAMNDVKSFIDEYGLADLFWCYLVVIGFENHKVVSHYGYMTEKAFVSGEKHRPWVPHSLENELFMELSLGNYEKVEIEGKRCIKLTENGRKRMDKERRMLVESGYMNHRMKLMYVSQFDEIDDWESILDTLFPTEKEWRRNFISYAGIEPGMEVLELGCGTGSLTFDSGLVESVGHKGWVTATDPSAGMLHRAETKLDQLRYENVTLEAASAEQIPYANREFDCTLGVAFFHFTDNQKALKEMIRVTRPGGVIGLAGPLNFNLDHPFFREWFEEIFMLAKRRGVGKPKNYLHERGDIGKLFTDSGLKNVEEKQTTISWIFSDSDTVVRHMIYAIGFFQQELIFMPLTARNELIHRLIEKGKDICSRYSIEERTIQLPTYYVKGIV